MTAETPTNRIRKTLYQRNRNKNVEIKKRKE